MKVNNYEVIPLKIGESTKWFLRFVDTAEATQKNDVTAIEEGKLIGKVIPKFNKNFKSHYFVWTNDVDVSKYLEIKEDLSLEVVQDEDILELLDMEKSVLEVLKEYEKKTIEALMSKKTFSLSAKEKSMLANKRSDEEIANIENYKVECPDIKVLYKNMKKIIYGQDEQMKRFLASIKFNIDIANTVSDPDEAADVKKTMLLIGSTGTGKTYMIKTLAKLLNIPYVIEDATRYTPSGYVGESVENILINMAAKNSLVSAQRGIVFIDEFDKICRFAPNSYVNTSAVQQSLLKMLEGTVIISKIREGIAEKIFSFDTRKTIFVLSGAFQDLSILRDVTEDILINYGMIPELAGRITSIIRMNTPTCEDLRNALTYSPRSYLKEVQEYLTKLGIKVSYDEAYLDEVAQRAYSLNEGYRGLRKIIDQDVDKYFFNLMSGDKKELTLSRIKKPEN